MKNVYLIIPDLHYNIAKEHRVNYFGEVLGVIQQILSISEEYRSPDSNVNLVFLGDVVDGSISQAEDAMRCQDLFSFIRSQVDGMYTVLGNHEENNVTDNPFWFMVSELSDESLSAIKRPIQPKGIHPIFQVPSVLCDGEVTFYFNHYGVPAKTPRCETGGKNIAIGLFHQNVGSNDICKMWGTFDNVEEASYIQQYSYCFFGHMHLAYGEYWLNSQHTCKGEWLGTCIGTNVNEVREIPRCQPIPVVIVEDGRLLGVGHKQIVRQDPEVVIDRVKLELTQANNKMLTECKQILSGIQQGSGLYDSVYSSADVAGMGFLVDMLQESFDTVLYQYRQGLENTLLFDESNNTQEVESVGPEG